MTWVKLDDHFFMHPKVLSVGPAAAWLWVASIGYANTNLTDGVIPTNAVPMLSMTSLAKAKELAAKLVGARLWEATEGGFRIHDYNDWNPTAAEVRSQREHLAQVRAEAGRAGGRRSGESRREAKPKQLASHLLKATDASGEAKRSPSPSPSPSPSAPDVGAAPAPSASAVPPPAKRSRPKLPEPVPADETPPAAGTAARAVFDAILGDRCLGPFVRAPAEFARRVAEPAAYPGVDVAAQVRRAGGWLSDNGETRKDGNAYLRGWLAREAKRVGAAGTPATQPALVLAPRAAGARVVPAPVADRFEMPDVDPAEQVLLDAAARRAAGGG